MNKIMIIPALLIAMSIQAMEQKQEFRQPFSDLDETAYILIHSGVVTSENLEVITIRTDLKEVLKSFYNELQSLDGEHDSLQKSVIKVLDIYKTNLGKQIHQIFDNSDQEGLYEIICASALYGFINIAKFLLFLGANVNASYNSGNTPLMWAAGAGHTEMVKMFIKAGANVKARNFWDQTALSLASEKGFTEIIELLNNAASK